MSKLRRLTLREREIMDAVFALGNLASAEAIRAKLLDPPTSSAVRAMLTRLEQKGYLRHEVDGLRYLYSARTSESTARRAALRQYLGVFFGGSMSAMMTTLVRNEAWTAEDLDRLQREIELAKKGRRSS